MRLFVNLQTKFLGQTLPGYCLYCHLVNFLITCLYHYPKFPFALLFGIRIP